MEEEYNIETTVEMEGGMQHMCNLSALIEERGIEEGKLISLFSLVSKGLLEKEIAANELGITVEQFAEEMKKAGY